VMLRDAGYEVVATHDDFEEAVEALDREKVDLILSDVRLRGKRTGIQLAEEAKKRGVPLLFVTGHPPDNAHELAIGCLRKPYSERQLTKAGEARERGVLFLFVPGHPPDNAHELAIGCLRKPYSERQLRKAIEAIDQHLSGEQPKLPKGLEIYLGSGEAR